MGELNPPEGLKPRLFLTVLHPVGHKDEMRRHKQNLKV